MSLDGLRRVGLGGKCKGLWSGGRKWGEVEGDGGKRRLMAQGESMEGNEREWGNERVNGMTTDAR